MTRLLMIGLDGGTDAVMRLPDARLAHIDALRDDGASATLRSTVPPITAAAWPSMLTGWNPGRHGMYDFRALDITVNGDAWGAGHSDEFGEGPRFVNSSRWRGAAVWDLAGVDHASVAGVPMTYPTWPIAGELIAGFPLPDYSRNHATPDAAGRALPPLLEGGDRMAGMADDELAALCRRLVDRQADVVRGWLADERRTLMVAVFQGTDFAQHRLWKYLDRPGHPLREALLDMYRAVDALVGEARAVLADDGIVMVVSDHGFGPHPRTLVRTNAALADAGLLAVRGRRADPRAARALGRAPGLRRHLRRAVDRLPAGARNRLAARYTGSDRIDWAATRAYRFPLYAPAEGVVVNLAGRQPQGSVAPDDYERVRDAAIAALTDLRDPAGRPLVRWARRREEVFSGRYADAAPDVVALFDPAFKATSGLGTVLSPVPPAILDRYSGVHAMDGVFAMAGAGVRAGVDLGVRDIVDVAPTMLALLGRQPGEPCDGRAMTEGLAPRTLEPVAAAAAGEATDPVYSADEQDAVERSLRSLGYLE